MALDLPSYLLGKKNGGGGGGTSDYSQLSNKPSINGITLSGDKTSVDLGLQNTTQYSTMPTASSSNVGQIVQYIGTTGNDYTNGYFYICVNNSGTYSWENLNVQASSGGTSGISYLGELSSFTQQNPLNLNNLEVGTYIISLSDYWYTTQGSRTIYFEATYNGSKKTTSVYASDGGFPINGIWVLQVINKVSDINTGGVYPKDIAYIFSNFINNSSYIVSGERLDITANSSNLTSSKTSKTIKNISILNQAQTISAKKTFNTLPESSVVPTTEDQLVNKKYVDGIVGNINTVLATLTTPGGE